MGLLAKILRFVPKTTCELVDIDKDLAAIGLFLKDAPKDTKQLLKMVRHMQSLREKELAIERKAKQAKKKSRKRSAELRRKIINLEAKLYDILLERFQFFVLDADIAAERVKKVAKEIKRKALAAKIKDKSLIKAMKSADRWTFDW